MPWTNGEGAFGDPALSGAGRDQCSSLIRLTRFGRFRRVLMGGCGKIEEVGSAGDPASIYAAFCRCVDLHADEGALRLADRTVTYRELADRADVIADRLAAAGVGHRDIVGLYLSKREEAIAAMLGVLKLGAAYLPFDTSLSRQAAVLHLRGQRSTRDAGGRRTARRNHPSGQAGVHAGIARAGLRVPAFLPAWTPPFARMISPTSCIPPDRPVGRRA